ncbi:MAG: hypothetical protein WHT45_12305 [Ignavibacterium sp.]
MENEIAQIKKQERKINKIILVLVVITFLAISLFLLSILSFL